MSIINKLFTNNRSMVHNDITRSTLYNSTRTCMPQHPEILIARVDKDNIIVALNKQKYITQMESILSDSTT